jgi:MOSC domain-containing protein YiiM
MMKDPLNSKSVGDASRFRTFAELTAGLPGLPSSPRDDGLLTRIVRRGPRGVRESLAGIELQTGGGLPGDAWERQRKPHPDAALAVMQSDVAELIANGQPLELSGDNLWLDLDLSNANLPTGSRLRIGEALLEVTPVPHDGCHKFKARFGDDAYRFVSDPELRDRNLRGIYLRVVEGGAVAVGDGVEVLRGP